MPISVEKSKCDNILNSRVCANWLNQFTFAKHNNLQLKIIYVYVGVLYCDIIQFLFLFICILAELMFVFQMFAFFCNT